MFYGTTIQSLKKGKIVDEHGTLLHKIADMKLAVGDTAWTDGNVIFGEVFEGTQLTGFLRSGVPVLGERADEKIRGYVKRNGEYKKYPIAEGTWIVNDIRMYFHSDSENYLDAEIAISDGSEVGYYSAHTTGARIYETNLYVGNDSGASSSELVLSITPTGEASKEICRVPLSDLLTDIIDWINAKILEITDIYAEYVNGGDFRLLIEPIIHLTSKLNNIKISPQRTIDMLYSVAGSGVIRLISNWRELSSSKYSREEFWEADFAFEHEENGGHSRLKEALIALWDYWLCIDLTGRTDGQIAVDIYSDSDEQIHDFEVTAYQKIPATEIDSDTSDCLVFADLPLETSRFVQVEHDAPSSKIDATLAAHELLSNKTLLHRAEKTSEAVIKTGQVNMRRVLTYPGPSVVVDYCGFVACYDDKKYSDYSDVPFVFGWVYTTANAETRYREIPSPVMSVRILPIVKTPYEILEDDRVIMDFNDPPSSDLNNPTLAMQYRTDTGWGFTGRFDIGWVSSDDAENKRVGTGFLFFEGGPAMFQNLLPLTDEYAYRFVITDDNPANDDYTHRHEVLLCISGEYIYADTWQRNQEEEDNKSEFSFPVQDKYVAKYRRDGTKIEGEVKEAEEKAWTMTGIYESDTKICGELPPQYDQKGRERASTDYNLSVAPLGANAANGYLVGVHDGKLYRYNAEDGFEEVGSELKNFRLREMKRISKAKK